MRSSPRLISKRRRSICRDTGMALMYTNETSSERKGRSRPPTVHELSSNPRRDRVRFARGQGEISTVRRGRESRERGIAVMLTAMMLLFTIPAMGLAIDAGLMYVIRGRLTAACDAASLATARNLNMGLTLSEQTASAVVRGNAFFSANFPTGYLGTTGTTPTITVAQTNLSTLTVTTSATSNSPLYFMRILGGTTAVAGAVGKASRRDVNMMLVLDRSGSMSGQPCADMITAAKTFVNMFVNGRDTMGLITFGSAVYLAYPPSVNFKDPSNLLTTKIDSITCGGWTNTSYSYYSAYQQLQTLNEPLALNMIVFFTDGVPTAFTAAFPIKTVSDSRYGDGYTCGTGSTCTLSKSKCNDDAGYAPSHASWGTFAPKIGVMTGGNINNGTGDTNGLANPVATSFSTSDPILTSGVTACAFTEDAVRARRDLAYIPETDVNGISTNSYEGVTNYTAAGHPYLNKKRLDKPNNISRVAINVADNAATAIRSNTTLNVVTYTIGLDGNGGIDPVLLKRMANDLTANNYDNTKVAGVYAYAPNSSDLNQAFARIASEILRLAQ
ncbi:MAG: VWA domain-containing protein [Bryobacteraceae bacterium]